MCDHSIRVTIVLEYIKSTSNLSRGSAMLNALASRLANVVEGESTILILNI